MPNILILGGGAAGLAAALAAAQSAPAAQVIVLERNPKPGKKLLATGNGRCNLDNTGIAPELYFTADPAALRPLLDAVNTADPLRWFRALGLYTRTDEAGRVYPYSNQAADVLALLEHRAEQLGIGRFRWYTPAQLQAVIAESTALPEEPRRPLLRSRPLEAAEILAAALPLLG